MNLLSWAEGLNGLLLEACVVVAMTFAAGGLFGWLLRGLYDEDQR